MGISFGDVLMFGLMLVSLFLMFVILLQRGRGGGLAGAFGGLGGQSAFGTKAGDVFTVITIVTVVIWVVLSCLTAWRLRYESSAEAKYRGEGIVEPAEPGDQEAATKSGKTKPDSKQKSDEAPDDGLNLDDERSGKADGGKGQTDSATESRKKSGATKDSAPEKPDDNSSSKE